MKDSTLSGFTVDDMKGVIYEARMPASVRRAIAALDKLKDTELVSRQRLADLVGVQIDTFDRHANSEWLANHRHRVGIRVYFGNMRAIQALRAQLKDK